MSQKKIAPYRNRDKRRLLLRFATHIDSSSFIAENAPVSIWVSRLFWSWSCLSLGTSPKSAPVMTVRRLPLSSSELSIVSETNAPGKIEVISFRLSFRHSSTCGGRGGAGRGGDVWRKGKPVGSDGTGADEGKGGSAIAVSTANLPLARTA